MASRFRTTEISDPAFESDNLRFITVKSPNLGGRGDICLFIPPEITATNLPFITLLHGVYGSAWIWSQKAGVHRTALRMIKSGEIPPMVIAMPSDGLRGDGSGYLPHRAQDCESWIADDVPAALIENIPQVSDSSPRFIAGLSMGGYGALRIGAKFAGRFAAISGHSSITEVWQMARFVEEPLFSYDTDFNSSVHQAIIGAGAKLPPLRFDCGVADELIGANRTLHGQLQAAGIPHIYEEFPGGHEWPYWTEHIADTLRFCAAQL
jgi:putative tributyrin esterase